MQQVETGNQQTVKTTSALRYLGEWLLLSLVLAAHTANALLWRAALPMWQGTDEAAHFGLAQYIAETGRLPGRENRYLSDEIVLSTELSEANRLPFDSTQRQYFVPGTDGLREAEIEALDRALSTSFERKETNQVMLVPPLYGALGALVYRLVYERDLIERSFALRLYSILLGQICLVFVYLLGREIWPRQGDRSRVRHLPLTLALLVAFHPQFTYSVAGGTSDVLAMLWFTVLTYLATRALRRGMTYPLAVGMGLSLGLGLLTKPHLFLTGPALALLFTYLWLRARERRYRIVAYATVVAGLGFAIWAGWAARSYSLHGNPFYDTLWASGWTEVKNPQYGYGLAQYTWDYVVSLAGGYFASYWAIFGYLDTSLAPVYYRVLQGLTLLSAAGLGLQAWKSLRARLPLYAYTPFLLLAVLALTPVLYFFVFNLSIWRRFGIGWPLMGRHFAGPLAAQMGLWMWGLVAWMPKRMRSIGHLMTRTAMVLFNYLCLFGYVLPRYYR